MPVSAADFPYYDGQPVRITGARWAVVISAIVALTAGVSANPMAGILQHASPLARAMFYPHTLIQIFGEELLTILPFLALLQFLTGRGLARRPAMIWSWIVTSIVFGLLHLPTYHWHLVQSVVVIGGGRMIVTLSYLRTKNIWVSTGVHVLVDWLLFTITLAI
jgi:membrane protease YdiL (CAAX protease family)